MIPIQKLQLQNYVVSSVFYVQLWTLYNNFWL